MKWLFDRQMLRDRLCGGEAAIGNDHPIPPFSAFYHSELPVRGYDPERARNILQKAGIQTAPLVLHASDAVTPGVAVDMAQIYAETARAGGLNVQPRRDPVTGYWDNVWLNEPLMIGGWGTRYTPDAMLRVAYRGCIPVVEITRELVRMGIDRICFENTLGYKAKMQDCRGSMQGGQGLLTWQNAECRVPGQFLNIEKLCAEAPQEVVAREAWGFKRSVDWLSREILPLLREPLVAPSR